MRGMKRWFVPVLAIVVVGCAVSVGAVAMGGVQAKGTPRLDLFFEKGFSDSTWEQGTFDRVAKAWTGAEPPAVGKKAVITVSIGRDGKIADAKLTTESGKPEWDKAALEAVNKAGPFSALPKSWTSPQLEVLFQFEFRAA
jgi:protein TonB